MFNKPSSYEAFQVTHYLNLKPVVIHRDEYGGHSPVISNERYLEHEAQTIIYLHKLDGSKTKIAVRESPERVTELVRKCGIKIAGGDK